MKRRKKATFSSIFALILCTITLIITAACAKVPTNPPSAITESMSTLTGSVSLPPTSQAKPQSTAAETKPKPEPEIPKQETHTEEWRKQNVLICRGLLYDGAYEDAEALANELIAAFPDDAECKNLDFSTSDLQEFDGTIQHIFFHPLIAYPSRAFRDGGAVTGQDLYMATVPEFNNLMNELYKSDYILVNFDQIFNYSSERDNVHAEPRTLMLPNGKKPFILSIDDMNYYEYMIKDGQVSKLIIDGDGEIATYSLDEDGNEVISKENEIVPLLDAFVREHPDFSYNNAKGVIGLTGFQGILGYRTNSTKYDNYLEEQDAVKPVVAQLKKTGWTFASHSQGHRHTAKVSYNLIVEDTDRYLYEVEPLVGYTPVYIYPFGEIVGENDKKLEYMHKNGFAVFCSVQVKPYLAPYGPNGAYLMSRRSIDGITLRSNKNKDMFDAGKVIDPLRYWYDEYIQKYGKP